jgi:hypothetical protein
MLAAEMGHTTLLQYLIQEAKADTVQRNPLDDSTLLMYACKSGNGGTISFVFQLFNSKEDATENIALENKVTF